MKRLGSDNLTKTAIDPELANLLTQGAHAAGLGAAGHFGANIGRMMAGRLTPNVFPRAAQTGVQHGFERRRLAPSIEKFLATGVAPESVAEYQMGREAGRLGRVAERALATKDPEHQKARLERLQNLIAREGPSKSPLVEEMTEAVLPHFAETPPEEYAKRLSQTSLGRSGQAIGEDVASRILGSAPPETKAFKVPKFMTTHEKAKPSVAGRAAGAAAMGAGVAAEPGYIGHIGVNKLRQLFAHPPTKQQLERPGLRGAFSRQIRQRLSNIGQKSMEESFGKGLRGEKTSPLRRAVRDVGLTPFMSELEDVGEAANIGRPMPSSGGLAQRLAPAKKRLGATTQKLKQFGQQMAAVPTKAVKSMKGVAGRATKAIPWRRAPKI